MSVPASGGLSDLREQILSALAAADGMTSKKGEEEENAPKVAVKA